MGIRILWRTTRRQHKIPRQGEFCKNRLGLTRRVLSGWSKFASLAASGDEMKIGFMHVAIVMLEPVFYESGIRGFGTPGEGSGAALEQNSRRAMIALLYLSLGRAQSHVSHRPGISYPSCSSTSRLWQYPDNNTLDVRIPENRKKK